MPRMHLESLEDRRLLSATLAAGVLTITGTDNADRVLVTTFMDKVFVVESTVTPGTNGGRPTVSSTRASFNRADVHSLEANLGAGNDRIAVSDGGFFSRDGGDPINSTLNGGAGDDVLVSGRGNDTLNGGEGNDLLSSDGGDDTVNGGAGNDAMSGGAGKDTMNGDSGNDALSGGAGDDTLNGDDGRDLLDGGRGADHLNGGAGNDLIFAVDFSDTDVIDGGANDADTAGDRAFVDRADTVSNVENVRTFGRATTTTTTSNT